MRTPMKLTIADDAPIGNEWIYEVKYDGYRVWLSWTDDGITLTSRKGKDLTPKFPEITSLAEEMAPPFTPFTLDGELVILNTAFQANFTLLQQRGRLRNKHKITDSAHHRPATFMTFDLLNNVSDPYKKRRNDMMQIVDALATGRIQYVSTYDDVEAVSEDVFTHHGEGIVAKHKESPYRFDYRSKQWIKIKNWRTVSAFLTTFQPENDYFGTGAYKGDTWIPIGKFKHGLTSEQSETLRSFFKDRGNKKQGVWHLPPSVCVDIACLDAKEGDLREPMFRGFRFDLDPHECTAEKLKWDLSMFPETISFTNLDKKLWSTYRKKDYLIYLRSIAPYFLPWMNEKKLTVIRYPDGIHESSFFQKHLPEHAPDFVGAWVESGETFITCQNVEALLWLGNQAAIEFHLPFQKAGGTHPDEIVFDLDPPDKKDFSIAVIAARLLKHLLDELEVHSFVKTSGNKGIQVHIPITEGAMTYKETRTFTEALAKLLIREQPDLLTTERLKKNRKGRLYIDYVQHAEGKTIIAPYSTRATPNGTVATPLYWDELTDDLTPDLFTFPTILERIKTMGCPFLYYHQAREKQPIEIMKSL
ncbi:DNA ligase D [Halobacillus locisalis]|uniref:DNA ligase D n=1 Tax=Halobacillus locisalis TaxID=220753 RepID=A0A838CSU2_9BACI|nr:DNA ligase D [Halobacillus locisalis]MBA2175014.1 DNA ligase D [Halobacillus locisalis]